MTHADLVRAAARWLRSSRACPLVLTEASSQVCREFPDAIGWQVRGQSILVEAKTTRGDFMGDQRKPHRSGAGMGGLRFYLTPSGLVTLADLPDGWGLLVPGGRGLRVLRESQPFEQVNHEGEKALLAIELRRVIEGWRKPGDRVGVFLESEAS